MSLFWIIGAGVAIGFGVVWLTRRAAKDKFLEPDRYLDPDDQ